MKGGEKKEKKKREKSKQRKKEEKGTRWKARKRMKGDEKPNREKG